MTRVTSTISLFAIMSVSAERGMAQIDDRAWMLQAPYPHALYQLDPTEYRGFVYSAGGYDGTAAHDRVYASQIQPNGRLGLWNQVALLPASMQGPGLAAINGSLFVIDYNGLVHRYPINGDGSLGTHAQGGTLPDGCGGRLSMRAYAGFLYVVGGWGGMTDIWMTPVDANGVPTGWVPTSSLPEGRQHQSTHFVNRRLYVVGGLTTGGGILASVRSAAVNCDGTISATWRTEASLPHPLWYHSSVAIGQDIYIFGGYKDYGGTTYSLAVYRGSVDPGDGTIAALQTAGTVPVDVAIAPGAVYSPTTRRTYLITGGSPLGSHPLSASTWFDPFCYANCDGSTIAPTLNVQDFACFLNRYAAGCS